MLSQNTLKSYHKTQIDPERLAPAVYLVGKTSINLVVVVTYLKRVREELPSKEVPESQHRYGDFLKIIFEEKTKVIGSCVQA